jgi:putative two-component system response regulator
MTTSGLPIHAEIPLTHGHTSCGPGLQVAIVDDTPMNVTFMRHLVTKLPECQAMCFTDAQVALQWCLDNDPDLLVVDYMMPRLSGIDLVRQFRQHHPDTPTLMVTANSTLALRHEALNLGVNDFLNKPLDKVEFLARARNMLAQRASHRKLADHAAWLAEEVSKASAVIAAQARDTVACLARAAGHRDPQASSHLLRIAHYAHLIAR